MVVTGKNAENYILSENVEKSGRQICVRDVTKTCGKQMNLKK